MRYKKAFLNKLLVQISFLYWLVLRGTYWEETIALSSRWMLGQRGKGTMSHEIGKSESINPDSDRFCIGFALLCKCISIEGCNNKTKVATTISKNKAENHKKPIEIQSKTSKRAEKCQ